MGEVSGVLVMTERLPGGDEVRLTVLCRTDRRSCSFSPESCGSLSLRFSMVLLMEASLSAGESTGEPRMLLQSLPDPSNDLLRSRVWGAATALAAEASDQEEGTLANVCPEVFPRMVEDPKGIASMWRLSQTQRSRMTSNRMKRPMRPQISPSLLRLKLNTIYKIMKKK